MRAFLVGLSIILALALWVWATGPGTSLLLALGGAVFAGVVGRITYVLLRPPLREQPPAPESAPAASSYVIRPRPRHRHHS